MLGDTDLPSRESRGARRTLPPMARPGKVRRGRLRHYRTRRSLALFSMALPGLLYIFIFKYLTMFGVVVAFKNYRTADGIFGSQWVGFKNFQFLFGTDLIWRAIRNTLLLQSVFIVVGLCVSLVIAILVYEIYTSIWTRFYQTTLFFPQFISWVLVGYFVFALLNEDGLVNNVLTLVGLSPLDWYRSPQYWPFILTFAALWKGAGIGSLLYLAGMLGIDPQLYEAARIDGASKWQEIRHITLPLLLPIIIINLLIAIGGVFNADFGLFFQVTRNSPTLYPTTDVMDTFIYRSLLQLGNVGMAAAAGLFQATVGFVLVLLSNWLVRRWDPERSLF